MKHDLIAKDFVLYVVHHFASMQTWSKEDIIAEIERKIKEADEDIVRCKDCKHGRPPRFNTSPEKYFKQDCVVCQCENVVGDEFMIYEPSHFCSKGERMEK